MSNYYFRIAKHTAIGWSQEHIRLVSAKTRENNYTKEDILRYGIIFIPTNNLVAKLIKDLPCNKNAINGIYDIK